MKLHALLFIFLLGAGHLLAASTAFTYQGVLRDEKGGVLASKNQTIEFRLYAQSTGGDALWGRTCNVLLDDSGLFNTELSDEAGSAIEGLSTKTLAQIFADYAGTTLYVGLTVSGSSGEIAPRQRILAVPYASFASDVSNASGDLTVKGVLTSDSVHTKTLETNTLKINSQASVSGNLSISGTVSGYGTIPVGGIILWSGSVDKIPDGWALCDGNGTPDLRDRFVVGAGKTYAVGDTGGQAEVKLSTSQIPSHSHSIRFKTAGYSACWNGKQEVYAKWSGDKDNGQYKDSTDSTGNTEPHENRPPYYALAYIIRVR